MDITIKYKIGQEVWFIKENKVYCAAIYGIAHFSRTYVGAGQYKDKTTYCMNSNGKFSEKELFETKAELLKTL